MSETLVQRLAHCTLRYSTVIVSTVPMIMFALGMEDLGVGACNWRPADFGSSPSPAFGSRPMPEPLWTSFS